MFQGYLVQNLAGGGERFDEHGRLIADRIGYRVHIFNRQRQIFREGAVVRHDAKYLAALAMSCESSFAKKADCAETKCTARDIDFSGDALSYPSILNGRGYASNVLHFADKLVAWCSAKIVVTAQNFDIGIADSGEPHAYQCPARPQPWQRFAR